MVHFSKTGVYSSKQIKAMKKAVKRATKVRRDLSDECVADRVLYAAKDGEDDERRLTEAVTKKD